MMEAELLEDGSVRVRVAYEGSAVDAGRMDARELAPAMLATAHLFEHTASLMYGSASDLKIEVNADFKRGSFWYELIAHALSVKDTLLSNLSVSDVIVVGVGALQTVRALQGRTPMRVDRDGDRATIVLNEGPSITVNVHVANMVINNTIRQDIAGAIEPLAREGIDAFRMESDVTTPERVSKAEIDYFRAPSATDELILDSEVVEVVQVIAPYFTPDHKWEFAIAGGERFWARIADKTFRQRVTKHEVSFGTGDALRVRMKFRVTRNADGSFDRDREILQVLDEIPARNDQISFLEQPQ